MSDIALIRPGCTDFDEQQRIQGTLSLPLNTHGLEQVEHAAQQLTGQELEVIYTSACEPARSTAEFIGDRLGVKVKELEGLENLNQGLWQGLQIDDVRRKYPKAFKQWQDLPECICPPQGETVPEAAERVRSALKKPFKKGKRFAIVASEPLATIIRCVIQGCRFELPSPPCGTVGTGIVEWLHCNGEAPAAPVNGQNGKSHGEDTARIVTEVKGHTPS